MTDTEAEQRQLALAHAETCYNDRGNPLYVWSAISCCLSGSYDLPIPTWCVEYLRAAANNLYRLSCGLDFRQAASTPGPRIEPEYAAKLVSQALMMSSQGRRNAFSSLQSDVRDMRAANSDVTFRDHELVFVGKAGSREVEKERNVSKKSAGRRITHGKRLFGVKPKTS